MKNDTIETDMRSITAEYDLPHAPAKVWRALTESKLVASWLMQNDLVPVVGHRFQFRSQPMPGWDGVVHCEVLEVRPHERLVYSWRGGSDELPAARLDSVVTWTLARTESGGTRLRLVHSGFTEHNARAHEAMSKGWRGMVAERIADVVASLPDGASA